MVIKSDTYSAGIMSECSWFLEFKKIVLLKNAGVDEIEIRRRCIKDNLFGMASENRIKRSYGYVMKRVNSLDCNLMKIFCDSDLSTQKLINFITILRGDKLFFEFINEVYREKNLLGYTEIEASDVNTFFREKILGSDELTQWKDTTFPKVRRCYLNFMTDANLLKLEKKHYYITPPIVDITLERYLENNGEAYILRAITGVY